MKISYNWLKEYCHTELNPEQIAELLTDCGLEVESIEKFETIKGGLNGLVVGLVKSKIAHPNADRLSITRVDIGETEDLQIVCGAPNVAEGQKVIVAKVGSILFPTEGGSFEIKKAKIRGELSEGMICAEDEIGLGDSHEGVMVLNENASVGMLAKKHLDIQDDFIFEIGLTPNRGDAASHMGVARDLTAVLNCMSEGSAKLKFPEIDSFSIDSQSLKIDVHIEDAMACPRYSGITISGIHVKESPVWLQNKLRSIGLKPINNIVDITNFVMQECGQPLHAFDAGKITGNKIIIKKSIAETKFITLDGIERSMRPDDLMICNSTEAMAIAGVFGGLKSGINTETKNIFIESAYFNPQGIRRTSKHHGLKTDASFRYERGADPEITVFALKRAACLIKEIAGGNISSEIIDMYPEKINWKSVNFTQLYMERISGFKISDEKLKSILTSLQIKIVSENADGFTLSIPPFKSDVEREADIAEEVLRIYGLNHIPMPYGMKTLSPSSSKPDLEFARQQLSDCLSSIGFFEIMNNSIGKPEADLHTGMNPEHSVKILNPLSSELGGLRQHMLPAGLETINYNNNRKRTDIRMYEFGKTYHRYPSGYHEKNHLAIFMMGNKMPESWANKTEEINFYTLKTTVIKLIEKTGIPAKELKFVFAKKEQGLYSEGAGIHYQHHHLADFGKLRKPLLKKFDINSDTFFADLNWEVLVNLAAERKISYREVPKQPSVRRDLALLLDKKVHYTEIENLAYQTERHLLKEVNLFDVYEGESLGTEKKSYALSFTLQDEEKTLTDSEIEKVMNKLQSAFEKNLGAMLRK
jgi:phenylalanyl-tRNA synthetase beta chain